MSEPTRVNQTPEPDEKNIRRGVIPVVIGLILVALIALTVLAFLLLNRPQQVAEEAGPGTPATATPTQVPETELPDPPSNLDADEIAIFDVPVVWADNSDNEHGFNIYRRRLDILGAVVQAGQAGEDETGFLDQTTVCGATYQYIIASYNNIGESPAQECWLITLPACPALGSMRLAPGADYGRNFITGALGESADFYFHIGADGRASFNTDGAGQLGIMDLGDPGPIPLTSAKLPDVPVWEKQSPSIPGHIYVVQARDEAGTLIIFRVSQPGNPLTLEYFLHRQGEEITLTACPDMGGRDPGGPCVSGDGVCDPTCQPETATLNQPVPPEFFDRPDAIEALLQADNPVGRLARLVLQQGDDDGDAPVSMLLTYPEGSVPPGAGDPTTVYETPTFTETDLDCGNQPCISGDGVCSPTCAQGPNFQGWNPAAGIQTAAWAGALTDQDCGQPCVNGDGVCSPQCTPSSSTTTPNDPGWTCIDADGDGQADDCYQLTAAYAQQTSLNYSPDPAHARRLDQAATTHCECLGETLACANGSYTQNHPVCSTGSGCTCNAEGALVCNDGTSIPDAPACSGQSDCACQGNTLYCDGFSAPVPNHPACAINPGGDEPLTTVSCACDGTTLACTDGTSYENHATCQPGITVVTTTVSTGTDIDCGGPCVQDGVCQPNCNGFWDPYDDSTQDGPGDDFQGTGPQSYAAGNSSSGGGQPGNTVDPDCGGPCAPGDPTCQCMPQGSQSITANTYNVCLPDCGCEQSDLVCRDANGLETWRVENSQTCGSSGGGLPTGGVTPVPPPVSVTVTPPGPTNCACQGVDWVCTNSAGAEVSRARDELRCGCRCSGPDVLCGIDNTYVGTDWAACGCSCQGTTLVCGGGWSQANHPSCQPQCTCVCVPGAAGNICRDSCTGATCKP